MLEEYPQELKYVESHQWIRVVDDGECVIIGFTSWFSKKLGEIINITLPEVGVAIDANEEIGSIESSAYHNYDMYSPISGEIIEINNELDEASRLINSDPYGDGWICKIRLFDMEEIEDFMSSEEYQEYLANLDEEEEFS